jgi:hypothetical protein
MLHDVTANIRVLCKVGFDTFCVMQVFDCGTFPERELVLEEKNLSHLYYGAAEGMFFVYYMSLQLAYVFGILAPVQTFYKVKP